MCSLITGTPRISTGNLLNITGVDFTVTTGEFPKPCIYQFNRSYAFVCSVSGVPTPQMSWYYQRTILEEITVVNNRTNGLVQYYINSSISVLEINLTRNTTGVYFCNATNDVGYDVRTVEAIVPPMGMLYSYSI